MLVYYYQLFFFALMICVVGVVDVNPLASCKLSDAVFPWQHQSIFDVLAS